MGIIQKKRRAEVKPLVGMLSVGDLRSATMLGPFVFCQATGLAGCCRWILEIGVCVCERAGTEGATRPDVSQHHNLNADFLIRGLAVILKTLNLNEIQITAELYS